MSNLVVKVHPNVYLGIVDAYERRKKNDAADDAAMGTLLGYYERNAVRVTNCYSVPFHVAEKNGEYTQLDHSMNAKLLKMHKKGYPHEHVVGWFCTSPKLTEDTATFHEYYTLFAQSVKKVLVQPPVVVLSLDTTFSSKKSPSMSVRAYTNVPEWDPSDEETEMSPSKLFRHIKVVFETSPQEAAALGVIMQGTDSKQREIQIVPEAEVEDKMCEGVVKHMKQITEWLKMVKKYVNAEMKKDESKRDSAMGRRLMEIVRTAATQLSPEKLEAIIKTTMSDQMLLTYLAELSKTNATVVENLLQLNGLAVPKTD
ncbi:hypothetical protein QR680_011565 [Steinernema hermaphroditum]|uniref:MPN domain-containing protein n=1 Tax=Steinernema hermaphroditum TaxID=289476 RepID=A0AA39LZ59_9BILA|nr:hypothetical protein QR680_011565 [Steinernema hermaphroditum]